MKATHLKLKPIIPLERHEQENFFGWLKYLKHDGKNVYDYAYAIPNGAFLAGHATQRAIQANYLKRQGLKVGYPDINIDLPVPPYSGLRLELKRAGAPKPAAEQIAWHTRLREVGYRVQVCYGCRAAQLATLEYFNQEGHP